jgi:hypothetical protein
MTNDAPARTGRIRSATIDRRCPDLSISSGLAAYRYRAGRGWQQGAIARSERSKHPRYFIFLDTLLDQTTPTPLVKTALQRLVSVEPEEENLDAVVNARQLAPLLRSPYEGLVYYMLETRKKTRGRFRTNQRVAIRR